MAMVRTALADVDAREDWISTLKVFWPSLDSDDNFVWELMESRLVKEGFDAAGTAQAGREFVHSVGVELLMPPRGRRI
jgi:hypothetical protein